MPTFNCLRLAQLVWIVAGSVHTHKIQDELLDKLKDYEIIIPSRVSREGHHVTFELHPEHSLRRRSAEQFQSESELHYSVKIGNNNHILRLKPNKNLLAPGFVIERKKNRFRNVTDSRFSYLDHSKANCHFHGDIVDQSNAKVAVGLCNGMHGFIHTSTEHYFIEPLEEDSGSPDGQHKHVVYRRSALPERLDPVLAETNRHRRQASEDNSCGANEFLQAEERRERWESHHRRKRESRDHHRSKRSFSTERYVETLIVVDPTMIKYHKNEHLETYVLTIMNMVATMFHDASIGNSINIVLVRILLMEEDQEDLVITHHADKTLQSFCKFQKTINFKDDDHPNHHDVAVLLTRTNICSRLNEPCGTLGLAQVSGMCQPHRSCSISEDTGLALAYTVTHELGHNFGMHHDGSRNGCEDPPGKQLFIMSPSLVADSISKVWSNCSKQAITQFIDRDWGYCLDDEPTSQKHAFPVLPPGTMYDADHQCRLQYGTDDATICTNEQDVCSNLWCKTENRCSTHLEAAAEGTICGTNKWCFEGKCVKIGDRPEAINGEWGEWGGWTQCSRTCGAGVSHSQRHCDNPAPSHGGKYCLGERKRYRICNTKACADTETSFNEAQCAEFNNIPYQNGFYEWEHVPTSETPCQLHCKPKNHFFSVLMKDIVTDGTPCTAGTRNMCISGRCRHVGCDYVIDSKAREDRCGVCHGDGSTCTTVKSQFNESQGLGYIEAAVIPEGARNIRVEEVAAASNFLALQNSKGEYYLNGHWFIQWSGDYKAAGTTIQYTRDGNKEMVVSPGPLKEPLHVMLLLQSSNPGVLFEYTVPKENVTEQRQPDFSWTHQPWTHCTASCGGGSQRSEVVCTELEAGIVDDKYCDSLTKPDDKQRVCNDHLCPARWWTGPWQHCSVTCGDAGVHHRTVICVRSLGVDEQIALDDEACEAEEKPLESEACHKKEPCPRNSTWIVGEWSSCNGNPCGQKHRKVECKEPDVGCDIRDLPKSEMPCTEMPCGEYVALGWSECTRSCGDGIQTRHVYCEGSDFCDTSKKPETQKHCNVKPCFTLALKTAEPVIAKSTTHAVSIKSNVTEEGEAQKADALRKTYSDNVSNQSAVETTTVTDIHEVRPNTSYEQMNISDSRTVDTYHYEETLKGQESDVKTSTLPNDDNITHITTPIEKSTLEAKEEHGNHGDIETTTVIQVISTLTSTHMHRHPNGSSKHRHETSEESATNKPDIFAEKPLQDENDVSYNLSNADNVFADSIEYAAHNDEHGTTLSDNDLPSIPDIDNLPLMPDVDLPDLPDIGDLSPLPSLEELPPIEDVELPKLPDIGKPNFAHILGIKADRQKQLPKLVEEKISTSILTTTAAATTTTTTKVAVESEIESKLNRTDNTSIPSEIRMQTTNTKETSSSLPQTENSQIIRPVGSIVSEPNTEFSLGQINIDLSGSNVQNFSLTTDHEMTMEGVLNKGPLLPRLKPEKGVSNYSWMPLDWTECSRHCGGGVRSRVVECLSAETKRSVEQMLCDINTKPTAIEDCNTDLCIDWVTSSWAQCSGTCGVSSRTRIVSCPSEGFCDPKTKPSSEEQCDVPLCVLWVSGQWSKCSKQCDGGEQLRLVQCIDVTSQLPSTGCDVLQKPNERQDCNTDACKDNNAALSVRCESNEMSASLCRALQKMGQCQNRFVALKCCKTCNEESHRLANKDRPRITSLR